MSSVGELCTWLVDGDDVLFVELFTCVLVGELFTFEVKSGNSGMMTSIDGTTPSTDETGEGLSLLSGVVESVVPGASEQGADNTDVGDWFSSPEVNMFDDMDSIGFSGAAASDFTVLTSLRGYGCKGFLFGRGGGISIAFAEPESPFVESRTT